MPDNVLLGAQPHLDTSGMMNPESMTDNSIPLKLSQAQPIAPNPTQGLDILGKITNLQNAQNQNTQFQQAYAAKQALGQMAQQSVGADGQIDYDNLAKLAFSNPLTAGFAA